MDSTPVTRDEEDFWRREFRIFDVESSVGVLSLLPQVHRFLCDT